MKKRVLSSVLVFMFAWVAVGALDCGCAFANIVEVSPPPSNISQAPESSHCHSSEESQSKKSEDTCCAGCQLESKAPSPQNVQLYGPVQNRLSDLSLSQSGVLGFTALLNSSQSNTEKASLQISNSRSVSFYGTPIYLAVQSFLI